MRQIAVTSCLVCTAAATSRLRLVCCCDMSHKFTPAWICMADRSDEILLQRQWFFTSHKAICYSNLSRRRVAAICGIVCVGLNTCYNWVCLICPWCYRWNSLLFWNSPTKYYVCYWHSKQGYRWLKTWWKPCSCVIEHVENKRKIK